MRHLILCNYLAPGDVCVMTATVKALHETNPGQFKTSYEGTASELFHHNPYISEFSEAGERIEMNYPAINQSCQRPRHFIEAYAEYLSEVLSRPILMNEFRPDIYISDEERGWINQVEEITLIDHPFWIIVSGGKYDYTAKWWDTVRFQRVVDYFAEKICFVQVGELDHYHPALKGVIDLRGKTDMRQLIRLVHHAQGALCPVTLLMHLAAGTPTRHDRPPNRPCVVIAGGREPTQWEAYPWHQYIHTLGQLDCCQQGCWKSRVQPIGPLNDDKNESLCEHPISRPNFPAIPKCMDLISTKEVVRRIESYFHGDLYQFLTPKEHQTILPHLTK